MDFIVTGVLGAGKTLYSCAFALGLAQASRMPIYSNIELHHPLYRPLRSVEHFSRITRAVVLLDEAHRNLDARAWSQNKVISDAILYNRKRMKHTVYTTPNYGNLDKRLRDVCPVLIVCDRRPNTMAIRVSWYDAQRPKADGSMRRVRFQVIDDPRPMYGFYNTQEEAAILPLTDTDSGTSGQSVGPKGRTLAAGRSVSFSPSPSSSLRPPKPP